jgi:hypothetical protein
VSRRGKGLGPAEPPLDPLPTGQRLWRRRGVSELPVSHSRSEFIPRRLGGGRRPPSKGFRRTPVCRDGGRDRFFRVGSAGFLIGNGIFQVWIGVSLIKSEVF